MSDSLKERIQKKAYEKFVARGCKHGNDFEDWLKAEKEVLGEAKAPKSPLQKKEQRIAAPVKARIK